MRIQEAKDNSLGQIGNKVHLVCGFPTVSIHPSITLCTLCIPARSDRVQHPIDIVVIANPSVFNLERKDEQIKCSG